MSENAEQNNIQQPENENTCVVCFKKTFIFSIGSCNHPVCYECSARMRCLCLQNECPICRQDLPRVIFTKTIDLFLTLDKTTRSGLYEKKFRIVFADLEIQKAFYHLLEHRCPRCEESNLFVDFYKLKEHVRKVHEQFYCEICTENLKVFSSERRCYTRSELAQHRRVGDPDNKSHKGHPRCDYCELRYLDKDELFRHLRREHYFCHLCDADGVNLFYGTVREMRDHFKAEHYLCEEDDCLEEEFTAVYRTEIDLRAHKATVHSKTMSRMEAKQARTLELDFSYGPRGRGGGNDSNRNPRIRTNDTQREFDINPEPQITQHPPIQIDTKNEQHFPSLQGPSNVPNAPVQLANSVRHIYYGQQGLARTKENFPALGGAANDRNPPKQNNGSKQSSSSKQSTPTASSLFKASGNKSASSSNQKNYQQKPQSSTSNSYKKDSIADFPSLGPSSGPSKNSFFTEASKFSSQQSIDRKPTTSVASKSSTTITANKKNSSNDFGSAASKKRDLLMEDLILPSNNNIDKGLIAAKHKGLMNDYVSIASQMTKVSLVKQKEESVVENTQFVPKLSSENNFPTLGASDSASKPPQWITVNSKTNNNNQKQQPQQNVGNENSNNPKKQQQQQYKVPQKNQKTNGTKKANDENKKTTNEKKIAKDNTNKENTMLESQLSPPVKAPPPGFKQIQPVTSKYRPMPDASKRNQALVEEFTKVLKTNESMQEFRLLSQMFRDGNYFARSYYESCKGVLGEKFDTIFPELLVLLPDIDRQQKLYRIHLEESLTDVDITDDNPSTKKKNKKSQKTLEVCATCQQVLLSRDLLLHVQSHSMENNFPTLSNEISSPKSKAAGYKK
ncbi:E3 ubiquitin-protein ligase ZNF598 [Chironomus tepperi]|uniref:E3 ubiquitin-protein ligase ZNF598 n=1 Tax=Chironomus tepperi TaxID=113505 RepID=UPI00391F7F1F